MSRACNFLRKIHSVGNDVPKLDAGCYGNFYCLGERAHIKNHTGADSPLFQLSLYLSYLRSQTVIMCHLPPEHPR